MEPPRLWETWGEAAWEKSTDDVKWSDIDEPDYGDVPTHIAEEELVRHLIELKLTGVLSAKQTCTIAFWAAKAGAAGPVVKS